MNNLLTFRFLCAISAPSLLPVLDPLGIQYSADDVIADSRKILDPASADDHDRVLLQVMTFPHNVSLYFVAVCQPHSCDFPEGGVWLFGSHRTGAQEPLICGA